MTTTKTTARRTKTTDPAAAIAKATAAKKAAPAKAPAAKKSATPATASTTKKAPAKKAPAKAAASKVVPRPETRSTEPAPATDRVERLKLAKAEKATLDAWQNGGQKGARPSTPNLDAIGAAPSTGRRRSTGAGRNPATVTWTRGGEPVARRRFTLGFMAYECTRGILSADSKRMTTAEFRKHLADEHGVTDPEHTTWDVTLSNGVRVGAIAPKASKAKS